MKQALMCALALIVTAVAHARPAPNVEPDDQLAPGEMAEDREAVVRERGYAASVRAEVPRGLRASVYRRYGIGRDDHRFVIDHRVLLSQDGANTARNMWPEPKDGPMNSHVKDGLENLLHRRVC